MRSGYHPLRGFGHGKARPHWEASADRLRDGHYVGLDAGPFVREELACTPNAALHLVEDEQQAALVAKGAYGTQPFKGNRPNATLTLDGLNQDRARFRR